MKIVVFGLSISSCWGNGHATLWRGLCAALSRRGHRVVFFERDVPYYAAHRDVWEIEGGELILYSDWADAQRAAKRHLQDADVGMVTSYCPDSLKASELVLDSGRSIRVFYDLDAPVTLARLRANQPVAYIGPRGLSDFDLVLSYAGGSTLDELQTCLGANRVAPLYGSADPSVHRPCSATELYSGDLSYLGTYSPDREAALNELFVQPARKLSTHRFVLGGPNYDSGFPWLPNIFYHDHVPSAAHPSFYCSSRLTLNVTRMPMAQKGFCPSGRLFEAAACGTPIVSDAWEGLERFFKPGSEILVANSTSDVVEALRLPSEDLEKIARTARERTLTEHTADARARDLETILESTRSRSSIQAERQQSAVERTVEAA